MEKKKKAGKVYYVCDRTACANCSPDCNHTSNIAHAKNFAPADINGNYPANAGDAAIFIERTDKTSATQNRPMSPARDLMEQSREQFKAYGDDIKAICAAADEAQAFGFRVCPRNVYADDIAKSICVCSGGKPCRNRSATCWKLYIKAAANNEHRAQ